MRHIVSIIILSFSLCTYSRSNSETTEEFTLLPVITLKTKIAGNPPETRQLHANQIQYFSEKNNEVKLKLVSRSIEQNKTTYRLSVKAKKAVNFNVGMHFLLENMPHETLDFLLPGLWYKRNLNISEGAPSMRVSDDWMFREDRLSTPMVAAYNPISDEYYVLMHTNEIKKDFLLPYDNGEVIMYGKSDLGSMGFGKINKDTYMAVTYPVTEYPKAYTRKLQLTNPITVFRHLEKGEELILTYVMLKGKSGSYSDFVREISQYAYDTSNPKPINTTYKPQEVKQH
ncbi:MAG: hypothetical protein ACK5MK_01610 [Dysgonomonas sp.]